MKTTFSIIVISFFWTILATAQFDTNNSIPCVTRIEFTSPELHKTIGVGGHIDVTLQEVRKQPSLSKIDFCKLFINRKYVGVDRTFPFHWKASAYSVLRNLKAGNYQIEASCQLKCGQVQKLRRTFEVKAIDQGVQLCYRLNPTTELQWMKTEIRSNPKILIQEYRKGNDRFFRIRSCHRHHNENKWYDCRGHNLGHHQPSGSTMYRQWYNGCS